MRSSAYMEATMDNCLKQQGVVLEPASPTGKYMNSSVLSVSVLCVMEVQVEINDLIALSLIKDVFLPANSRFSSIMVESRNGVKQWKRVEVQIEEHVIFPIFPDGLSPESYDEHLGKYISKIAMEELPQRRPLWEIHIIKYPTSHAAETLIFKLHHALGDGFSLMGVLFSCLERADNPSLPLTFPSFQGDSKLEAESSILRVVPRLFSTILNTISDFGWSFLKSTFREDDRTPIRSGDVGVESRPKTISTITFSLDHIKMIKKKLGVTVNDVISGIIFLGIRLYMQSMDDESSKARCTALVLLNTRMINGYKSIKEMMMEPHSQSAWGNKFAFLHVSVPDLAAAKPSNPLDFIAKAHDIIKNKRISLAPLLTAMLLQAIEKFGGPEKAAQYIYNTVKNTSLGISNLIGPTEQIAIASQPIGGLYFTMTGVPHSLSITIMSYMGKIRVCMAMEDGLIDPIKLKSCIDTAFHIILDAAMKDSRMELPIIPSN